MAQQDIDLDLDVSLQSTSPEDAEFDEIIGALEDTLMDEEFNSIQEQFFENNCDEFENTDENKLIYSDIHKNYISTVETKLIQMLSNKIERFDMNRLEELLVTRKDEIGEDLLSLLLTFNDFNEFKDIMLNHKNAKHGESKSGLFITGKRVA